MRTRIANVLAWAASVVAGHKDGRKVSLRLVTDGPGVLKKRTVIYPGNHAQLVYR